MATSVINAQSITLPPVDLSTIKNLLALVVEKNGSDLHIAAGYPPFIRIDGVLCAVGNEYLSKEKAQTLVKETMTDIYKQKVDQELEVDYGFGLGTLARFRVNAFYERGNLSGSFRLIPTKIPSLEDLHLPKSIYYLSELTQGFVLVTGPTGSGKSTTLAAIIDKINSTQNRHIITVEDPIEYIHTAKKSFIAQRELEHDTKDWKIALKSSLRQDPEVVLIGEMRDFDTIAAALTIAETGHLVFATLHTNSASQAIDRIIDVFPPHQQNQIRVQLANVIQSVVSQRLVALRGGGRQAALEILIANSAVKNLIREGKSFQIDNVIATGSEMGMMTMEQSLVNLVREGKITVEDAQNYSLRPDEILKLLRLNKAF
jgi:twitching motility protein PilT